MNLPEIFLIAVGLSMDAFAVSVTLGISAKTPKLKQMVAPGAYFGFFQALMPVIGYFAGTYFAGRIQSLDHWIAFILLAFIGGKMVKESFSRENKEKAADSSFTTMLILSLATSIDALAIGVTFAFLKVNIIRAVIIISITTFIISVGGVKIGAIFGTKFKSKAELAGGLILIIIGLKVLAEHTLFN
jgi:putative Mn2+ efflux pump MntP